MPRRATRPVRQRKIVTHYSDDNPSTFTVKQKKGECVPLPLVSTAIAPLSRKRKVPSQSKSPLPEPEYDSIISHRSRLQTILPVQEFLPPSKKTRSHLLSFGVPGQVPPLPTWSKFPTHDDKLPDSITWLSVRQDDANYAVTGDCRGSLALLRHSHGILLTIQTTSAAKREANRYVASRRKTSVLPNAIVQAVWSHDHVVLLTRTEVECVSVADQSIVFTIPVDASETKKNSQVPLLALQGKHLLWSTNMWSVLGDAATTGSLLVGTADDASLTKLSMPDVTAFRCWTALWEEGGTFLFVATTSLTDSVELCRGRREGSEILVSVRQELPSARNPECAIQQFDQRTFVCGRGIRMYNTVDLTPLATFGESVQLHSQLASWSRCCWLPTPYFQQSEVRSAKRALWLEREDFLAEPQGPEDPPYWLMGIPHPRKGPELQSTFYFLSTDGAAATTRDGPPKGCLGDVWVDRQQWKVVVVSAERGRLMQLAPTLKSDFPGVMYPVGYNEIDDNIDYFEDEDELDELDMDDSSRGRGDEKEDTDPELVEAMRQSLLEQRKEPEEIVDVLASDDTDEHVVATWPEILRSDSGESVPGSPQRVDRTVSILPHHIPEVHNALDVQCEEEPETKGKPVNKKKLANIEALLQSSVDSDLRRRMGKLRGTWGDPKGSALNPVHLQHSFEEKTLALELLLLSPATDISPPKRPVEDAARDEKRCPACMGRLVFHSCGKREMPIDHDAIERADREREEKEQAEKQRVKVLKRKQAEARRKETKRLRRLEEEEKKEEEQRVAKEQRLAEERYQQQLQRSIAVAEDVPKFTHQSPYHGSTFNINGNEVQPSTSLHPTDALAALAGLADSLSQPMVCTERIPTVQALMPHHTSESGGQNLATESAHASPPSDGQTWGAQSSVQPAIIAEAESASPLNILSSASAQVSEEGHSEDSPPSPPQLDTVSDPNAKFGEAEATMEKSTTPASHDRNGLPNESSVSHTEITEFSLPRSGVWNDEKESYNSSVDRKQSADFSQTTEESQIALSALVMLCGAAEPIAEHPPPKAVGELSERAGVSNRDVVEKDSDRHCLPETTVTTQGGDDASSEAIERGRGESLNGMGGESSSTEHPEQAPQPQAMTCTAALECTQEINGLAHVATGLDENPSLLGAIPTPDLSKDSNIPSSSSSVDHFVDSTAMKGTGGVSTTTKVEG